jgi:hypothetical protein
LDAAHYRDPLRLKAPRSPTPQQVAQSVQSNGQQQRRKPPPVYGFEIKRKGRWWEYRVHDHEGFMVAIGSERTRLTARYRAERSLFAALLRSSRFYGSSSDNVTLR